MSFRDYVSSFIVGIALFSMFFGGGNLTFPLWIGIQTSSLTPSMVGFLISGVLIPFFGIAVGLYYKGNYDKYLGVWGKTAKHLLVFFLLIFWIPLGSGPRCNQLAYGAFTQTGWQLPLWGYSVIYSVVVYFLTYRKSRILDILGNFVTPLLLVSLVAFVYLGVQNFGGGLLVSEYNWGEFMPAFTSGYYTMDFIATVFFTATLISLIKERKKGQFQMRFVRFSCVVAITMLSITYIGMIFVGHINSELLRTVTRDQLLAALGRSMFHESYYLLIFAVITLSCLTTSVALALVFSDYLRVTVFRRKLGHKRCLVISLTISFGLSTIGFEPLAVIINYAMSTLYPFLIVTSMASVLKEVWGRFSTKLEHDNYNYTLASSEE